jgi:hypothetical protein
MMQTLSEGQRWIEKSPINIFCVNEIDKHIQGAKFVHVLRNGEDNIASLIDAGNKYGTFAWRFGGSDGVKKAVAYYNNAVRYSLGVCGRPNHVIIRYEDLAAKSSPALEKVSSLCNIAITKDMLKYQVNGLSSPKEEWKRSGSTEIAPAASKFHTVLDEAQRRYVAKHAIKIERLLPRLSI